MNWYNKKKEFTKKENKSCITMIDENLVNKAFKLEEEKQEFLGKIKKYNTNYNN